MHANSTRFILKRPKNSKNNKLMISRELMIYLNKVFFQFLRIPTVLGNDEKSVRIIFQHNYNFMEYFEYITGMVHLVRFLKKN